MKLGKRLSQIESMVQDGYEHIWDCCCDHGLLGASLLTRKAAPHIHFVDIVPALMERLENKLKQFFPQESISETNSTSSQWHTHCQDIATLPIDRYTGKQLIIIAGIGGDLMIEIITKIYTLYPHMELDFLLCPVHHNFRLRETLIKYRCHLQREVLVEENHRFYEILLISTNPIHDSSIRSIIPVGEDIWRTESPNQQLIAHSYLEKTIAHYQRMQTRPDTDVQSIIDQYQAVRLKLIAKID